jgi:hypothetical protein
MNLLTYGAFAAGLALGIGATVGISKAIKPNLKCPACPEVVIPPCPACPPQTTVDIGNFDVNKLQMKKGTLNYSPHLENIQVVIDCQDSVLLKQMLNQAKK